MYLFLFEPRIFKCLNYVWIFIWIMYFKVLELCIGKIISYDFTIRVYIVFFVLCQKCIFDNLLWKDLVKNSVATRWLFILFNKKQHNFIY